LTKSLLRILYSSKTHQRLSEIDLTKLLQQSRQNNWQIQIHGILCYNHSDFIQVLEGPETAVIKLYQKILDDDRHYDCKLINICLSNKYIFNDWSMGYIDISQGNMRRLRQELPEKLSSDNADKFAFQLKHYLNSPSQKNADQTLFI
tara:strand:+ start:128778 stop:129218 length:441 start_codon:yes stop_codon:yes gene_type:complete